MLGLRLGKSFSERILPMPKSPFLSAFLATEVDEEEEVNEGVDGPTQSSSTLCTYFLWTSKPQSAKMIAPAISISKILSSLKNVVTYVCIDRLEEPRPKWALGSGCNIWRQNKAWVRSYAVDGWLFSCWLFRIFSAAFLYWQTGDTFEKHQLYDRLSGRFFSKR